MTPLTKAAKRCDLSTTRELITKGANVNETSTGKWTATALHWTLYECEDVEALKIIRTLVKGKARLDIKDSSEYTPLMLAVSYGKSKSAMYLIENSNDIDKNNIDWKSLLFDAVLYTDQDLIKLLASKTGTVNIQNHEGFTPLMYATIYGNTITLKYLLDLGADPTYRDVYGKSALDYAMSYKNKAAYDFLKMAENKPEFAKRQPDPSARIKAIISRVKECMIPHAKDYAISISNDDNANASVNIAGHITFTREAIRLWDDDMLTFVAAHEIAHDKMGHVAKKVTLSGVTTGAMIVADIFVPGVGIINRALNPALVNNYSKFQEYEADKLASESCERCFGMTIEKQIEIMERIMETAKQGDGGGFWATHPAWSKRIQNIKEVSIEENEKP